MLPRQKPNHLSPYRRHNGNCKVTNDLACDCPVWVQGRLNGRYIRESLNTRSLASAEQKVRGMLNPEPDGPAGLRPIPIAGAAVSLDQAEREFIDAKKERSASTVTLYADACRRFIRFAERYRVTQVRDVTPQLIQRFFSAQAEIWKSPETRRGRLAYLRLFFGYCVEMEWLAKSPAASRSLSFQGPSNPAREPLSAAEIDSILGAVGAMPEGERATIRALVLVLLYSGMRISDAAFLERRSISELGILDYVSIKTRKRISLPMELHLSAIEALAEVGGGGRDFFFVREGDYKEALRARARGLYFAEYLPGKLYTKSVNRLKWLMRKLLALAQVPGGCHRFRDTYAVSMLTRGVDIYTVSLALGHSDVKITSKHYLNLVPGYRERMSQASRVLDYTRPVAS